MYALNHKYDCINTKIILNNIIIILSQKDRRLPLTECSLKGQDSNSMF